MGSLWVPGPGCYNPANDLIGPVRGSAMSDDASEEGFPGLAIGLYGLIFVLIAVDVAGDYAEGADLAHLAVEALVMLGSAAGVVLLLGRYVAARRSLRSLQADLGQARADAERWRAESQHLIAGLGAAIEMQFERWGLSPAEAEIGLLLLKGLSHKELAALRQTSERTVREQSRAIYRKAGLSGRSSLAAFFLEDLLLPARKREEPPG